MPEARPLRRAAFLDRDGTICEEMGYVNHVDRLRIFPFAAAAIRRLNDARIPVIVVTNQSGIARNIFPESLVQQVHKKMISSLRRAARGSTAFIFARTRRKTPANAANRIPACSSARLANMRSILPLPGWSATATRISRWLTRRGAAEFW